MKKSILKVLKISGLSLGGVLALLFLIPVLFPGTVVEKVKTWTNERLNGELNFSEVRLSFFNHFPSLTVTLYDVSLKGSAPFSEDTLVAAGEIALGINVSSLVFDSHIHIDEIFVADAKINVLVDKKGGANYNVYVADEKRDSTVGGNSGTALKLEKINIKNTHFVYSDKSIDLLLDAKGFNYTGKGDLSKSLFDLYSNAAIDSLDFYFGNEPYLINKKIDANLITKINTSSLALLFEKNDLIINRLPVQFSGKIDFLQNGYDIDFKAASHESNLYDLVTALPPQYLEWLDKTEIKGVTSILLTLKGQYIASRNTMPDLVFDMQIRDGYVRYEKAPSPASNIYLDLKTKMPGVNIDSLQIKIDSAFFNIDKDYFSASVHTMRLKRPYISANIHTLLDLAKMDEAFGFADIDCKGKVEAQLTANGRYDPEKNIFPVSEGNIRLTGASLKTSYYPNPISDIQLIAQLSDPGGTLKDLDVKIDSLSFQFEGKPFTVRASLTDFENIIYDIRAKGEIDVARVYKVFAQEGLNLGGLIVADLSLQGSQADAMNGSYERLHNEGTLQLENIETESVYFPLPFIIKRGIFKFAQDKVWFDEFLGVYGQSDFRMDGYLQNVIDYVFSTGGVLKGAFNVHSDYINVNEFIASAAPDTSADKEIADSGVFVIPPGYELFLRTTVNKVLFNDLELGALKGAIAVNNGTLHLSETGFQLIDSKILMDAKYANIGTQKASFDYHIRAKDFDIKKAYDTIKLFRDLVSVAAKAEGIVSLDYKLKGILGGSMTPVYPSLEGAGTLSLKNVKVKGLKMFSVISRKVANDSIDNPNLKQVNIKSTIKNNVITIERFKFRVFGFRPRIEGKTNFDGQLKLQMRLGLPPLGIVGIPISITGTSEDPTVKLGKRNSEEIDETEYME